MIKILHIVSDLDINSGAMNVVMNYYRNIDRSEVQFDFGYFNKMQGTYEEEIRTLGGNVFYLGRPSLLFKYQKRLRVFFENHKGDYKVVHCHPIWASIIVGMAAKRTGIKRIIQHSHSTRLGNNKASVIRNRVLLFVMGFFATDYVACSEDAAKLMGKRSNVQIIHNAIDCERFSFSSKNRKDIRRQFGISDKELLIGHVGRFSEEKNHSFLLSVFGVLLQKHPDSRLILVGDGPLKKQIEDRIEQSSLSSKVLLIGKRTDIPALLSSMDVFVFPSKYEGVPFAIVEAQFCGLPCVISSAVTKEIESNLTTYVDLAADFQMWSEAILTVAMRQTDREHQGTTQLLGYNIKTESKKMQDYYLRLCD